MEKFETIFRYLTNKTGRTQKEIALDLKISQSKLSCYLNGRGEPSYDFLIKIADYFNVSVPYLQGFTNINTSDNFKFNSKKDAVDCIEKIMKALGISKKEIEMRKTKMNRKWSEQEIKPGWIVQLKFVHEDKALDAETDNYIIANDKNTNYSLVSLTDGKVIATADSVDYLKSVAEKACDSSIELIEEWPNIYDWGIEL